MVFRSAAGKYSPKNATGITDCTPCAIGKFTNVDGQPVCIDCDAGTFANGTGRDRYFSFVFAVSFLLAPRDSCLTRCEWLDRCMSCPQGQFSQKLVNSGATSCTVRASLCTA